MAKDKISDYSATANSNTDIAGINIDEGCAPSGINDAIRTLMKQLKDWQSGSQDIYIHPAGSAAAPSITATGDTNTGIFFPAADTVGITTGGTERARVDSAGNLGLGVTPSAWWSGIFLSLDVGSTSSLWNSTGSTNLSDNLYYSSGGLKYKTTAAATRYQQNAGQHIWFNVPSGTANTTATATQAMTLDASGNLLLGATSGTSKFTISGSNNPIQMLNSGGANQSDIDFLDAQTLRIRSYHASGSAITFATNASGGGNTERARIDSSGNLLVGTTSYSDGSMFYKAANTALNCWRGSTSASEGVFGVFSNTGGSGTVRAYFRVDGGLANYSANNVNLSDENLKKDISLAGNYLAKICAIPVKNFRYKDQSESENITLGVIAQDVLAVAPELVSQDGFGMDEESKQNYLSVYQTDLQYALMKSIQELKAIVDAQASEIAALKGQA